MELAAIYHRPNSEWAYMSTPDEFVINLRAKHNDLSKVEILYGDPYDKTLTEANTSKWNYQVKELVKNLRGVSADYWQVKLSIPASRRLAYAFRIYSQESEQFLYDDRKLAPFSKTSLHDLVAFRTPYLDPAEITGLPAWVAKTIWYQLMPDRFANGQPNNDKEGTVAWDSEEASATNFFGGDLAGIIDKLDYLQELGINGLDLTPIFTAYSNHKYDTADFWSVDPAFGNKEDLKRLVDEAHRRQMKVMLEGTFDHLSDFSLQWQDVHKLGAKSRFAKWFKVKAFPVRYTLSADPNYAPDASYAMFANNPHLPKLNLHEKAVQDYLLEVLTYWVQQFDIDAWRIGTADEFPPSFSRRLVAHLNKIKPDFYLVGENNDTGINTEGRPLFNGGVNYPLVEIMKDYFLDEKAVVGWLIEATNTQLMRHANPTLQGMLLGLDGPNSPRLLDLCHQDKQLMRALLAYSFLQIGSPVLFYGTELGLTGASVPANRACMKWKADEQDETMLRFIKVLADFRKAYNPLITKGSYEWGQYSSKYDYLSFTRRLGKQRIFALFNLGYSSIKFVLPANAKLIMSQNLIETDSRLGQYGFVIIEAWLKER